MNFFQKLFTRKKALFNRDGLIVKVAFVCGGVEYMEVENILELRMHRGQQATHVYRELKMGCDDEFLKAHVTACDNIFNGKKIGIDELSKLKLLNDQLKERLYKIVDTDLIYKLAAVVFFDKNESPYEYDEFYAKKKIAHWKQHADAHTFFLQEPLIRLIPFLGLPEINFQTYSQVVTKLNSIHWDVVFELLTESQKEAFKSSRDYYAAAIPQESVN